MMKVGGDYEKKGRKPRWKHFLKYLQLKILPIILAFPAEEFMSFSNLTRFRGYSKFRVRKI